MNKRKPSLCPQNTVEKRVTEVRQKTHMKQKDLLAKMKKLGSILNVGYRVFGSKSEKNSEKSTSNTIFNATKSLMRMLRAPVSIMEYVLRDILLPKSCNFVATSACDKPLALRNFRKLCPISISCNNHCIVKSSNIPPIRYICIEYIKEK